MNFLLVVITLFSLIFGVSGWAMYFKQAGALDLPLTQQGAEATPTPGSEDMAQATPTPEPMPVNLEVLNGSGVSGAAASTATKLQALGYTVVRTGNADASNYETSQIILNEDFTESEALLTKLEAEFGSAEKSEDALTGSTASARIIVGKDWTE